jgi:hypothetical protein
MPQKINKKLLQRRWLHAHEEDTPGKMVFRPDTYALPPSRGRTGYEFQPGGQVERVGPGPTDRHSSTQGTWKIDSQDELTIDIPGAPTEVFTIGDLDTDRLILKK